MLGLFTRTSWTRDIGSITETVYEYDAQGRLVQIVQDGDLIEQYDPWDEFGRRVHGVRLDAGCLGADQTYTYDDTERTIRHESSGGPTACEFWFHSYFDEDFLRTRTDYHDGAIGFYTTLQKETVCRD